MFEKISGKFTLEQKLLYSIIYGWGVLILFLALFPFWVWITDGGDPKEAMMGAGFWGAAFFLAIRYSMLSPVLGLAGEGAKIVGFTYIFGLLFDRRNSGYMAVGALIGALFVLVFVLLINAIRSFFYLIRETYTYFMVKKENSSSVQNIIKQRV